MAGRCGPAVAHDIEDAMKLKPVKGMQDILPEEVRRWQVVEERFRRAVELHGFAEVRTPLLEATELFQRSTGETTEVVEKQMFTLERGSESLSLRPEGTPSSARAYIHESVYAKQPVSRWYYLGPMFRAEQPQRGRQRQFHQAGCEIYGDAGPLCDAELIDMLYGLLSELGVAGLKVSVNSLGGSESRARYRDALIAYFEPHASALSSHAQERFRQNPLRVLDSKDERDRSVAKGAPSILDLLTDEDRAHWQGLLAALDALGTPYEIDEQLVRGLDYYTRTTFEISTTTGAIGSQNALLGGGRYDDMIAGLGGPATPAIGFAMGLERVLLALGDFAVPARPWVALAPLGPAQQNPALTLAKSLRQQGFTAEVDGRGTSLKSMLRRANAGGARFCVVIGEAELAGGVVQLKDLALHAQEEVPFTALAERLAARLTSSPMSPESEDRG
ncbi:MAG TPA: histidine--tRNA ligase [Polyangiaceae bacterium]|nr:histidine--tRNA ligase [Polyangiaceae bacterium]